LLVPHSPAQRQLARSVTRQTALRCLLEIGCPPDATVVWFGNWRADKRHAKLYISLTYASRGVRRWARAQARGHSAASVCIARHGKVAISQTVGT